MQICIYDRYIFACGKLVESSDHEIIKYYSRKLFKNILIKIILQWKLFER